ncbi:MAG: hypothetical protein IJ728_13150 [Selenomonadaceae bacterium]|nr:hypothetical protein [Selenomonadaceae bacterium]
MPKKRRGDTDGFAVIFSDHGSEIVPAFVRWRVNVHAAKIDGILADKKENCLLVGYFDNKILAENALKYTKTKFFRAILKFQQLCQFNPYVQPSAFQPSIGLGFDDSKSWFDSDQGFDWSKKHF